MTIHDAAFVQQQEAAAHHIIRVVCPEYILEDVVLSRINGVPLAHQLTRRDYDIQLPLLPYWDEIGVLPDVVLAALLVNLWTEFPMDMLLTKLAAAGIVLHGMAVTTEVFDRLLDITMEARADGYERAECDESIRLSLPGEVRLDAAREKAARVMTEGFITADEEWMYLCGWMRGYQDLLIPWSRRTSPFP